MGLLIATRRALLIGGGIAYLLNDSYNDTVAAGSVNGTAATPGPGTRGVTDANSKLSIGSGVLSVVTGGAAARDPGDVYDAIARTLGRYVKIQANVNTEGVRIALSDANTTAREIAVWIVGPAGSRNINVEVGGARVTVGAWVADTDYELVLLARATGAYHFVKGGAFTAWTLLYVSSTENKTPLYPVILADDSTSVYTADYIRIPDRLFIPPIALYDTFTRANGALGDSETVGPDGQVVTARTWDSGGSTWAIAGNEAVNTPTVGAEDVSNGNMESGDPPDDWTASAATLASEADERTGGSGAASMSVKCDAGQFGRASQVLAAGVNTWMLVTAWGKKVTNSGARLVLATNVSATIQSTQTTSTSWTSLSLAARCTTAGCRIFLQNITNALNDEARYDDVSAKPLTLNELFTAVDDGETSDYLAEVELDTVVTSCGMVLNLDDKDTPANFIIAYHDKVNAKLDKCVAGTYTSVISAAATYAAGAVLKVHKQGTSYALFYNNAKIGSTSTISDAGIISNTKNGMFSTNSGNQLDNFTVDYRTHPAYSTEFDLV